VAAVTRALKVEALIVCSAWRIRQTSRIFAARGSGSLPDSIQRKFDARSRSSRGSIGSSPRRVRWKAATSVGSFAISRTIAPSC